MNDDRYDGLSETERDAMRSMASGAVPREGLEDDTVRFLASHGQIGSRKRGVLMKVSATVGALVAVALVFVAGVTVGKRGGEVATTASPDTDKQYMLLLYETAALANLDDETSAVLVGEYREWGVRLAEQGRLVGAEKLKSDAFVLAGETAGLIGHPKVGGRVRGGFFLIRASSMEHARKLASTHPHLKHGGEIEIRPLDLHN
jgi:hypothetical protein